MSRPRLLLVPFVTELEWDTIEPSLAEWADVATFDPPGVGNEPLPPELDLSVESWGERKGNALELWRSATAARGVAEADRRGWSEYFIVADSYGITPAVLLARRDRDRVRGLALGHATLSHRLDGPRPPVSKEIWDAMTSLMRTDTAGFIAYGIAQMTQGAVSEQQANRWLARFPDREMVATVWERLAEDPEPVGDELRELELPLLLAQHLGCLVETQEGFEDIVAEFPDAATVRCPEACAVSPSFAAALREFCGA